jgi:glycogen debranching enzyme
VQYAFTCPATPRYRHQWYWDSCFHAIAWRHFEPARAREELRTLVRAGRLDGFIPHTAFWDRPAYWRRAPFYGTHTVFGCSATSTIQTPLLALAWELVALASREDDPTFATEGLEQLRLHYDWLDRERDPDDDGLITTFIPDESGLDDTPKYDRVFGWMRHDRLGHAWLIERSRRLAYDAARIVERYDEHVEDVLVNVLYALSLRALSRLDSEHGATFEARAERTEAALLAKCYDERTGIFYDLHGRAERPVTVSTWSALTPLALGVMPEDVRRRIVEEHLLHPRRYLADYGIPSVSQEEPTFNPGFALWRCWRGPAWVNTAWLLTPSMRALGYEPEADRIVGSLARAAVTHGLREYYNPLTGRGLAARDFGMSALLADLFANSGTDVPTPSAWGRMMHP